MAARKDAAECQLLHVTATAKNKTLEIFDEAFAAAGQTKHRPFPSYSVYDAISSSQMALEKHKPDSASAISTLPSPATMRTLVEEQ